MGSVAGYIKVAGGDCFLCGLCVFSACSASFMVSWIGRWDYRDGLPLICDERLRKNGNNGLDHAVWPGEDYWV